MRGFCLLLVLPLLAGCAKGDWDYLTSFGGSTTEDAAAPPVRETVAQNAPAPRPGSAAPNAFCLAVAKQDATGNGFDTATQSRIAQRNYQQCVGIFGDVAGK